MIMLSFRKHEKKKIFDAFFFCLKQIYQPYTAIFVYVSYKILLLKVCTSTYIRDIKYQQVTKLNALTQTSDSHPILMKQTKDLSW